MPAVYESAMTRALELALRGPAFGVNPQVGAVILDESLNIVSEGWHEGAGTPHAEVMALSSLPEVLPAGYTAVVTLEPCNHTGRTGPCAQALIASGISRVVYASSDPGVESGSGASTLRAAGVEVLSGVLESLADDQSRVWLTSAQNQRPFVTLKWAQSLDGRAMAADGSSQWISGPESRAHAHVLRSEIDAILVGTGTVLADNPSLTARKPDGSLYPHQPLRVVMGNSMIPNDAKVFDSSAETIRVRNHDVTVLLAELYARGVKHLMVEGGPTVASAFVRAGLVDEFVTYLAPQLIGGPGLAVTDLGVETMASAYQLVFKEVAPMGADIFIRAARSS
ncbi:MAG: bifunctional diaminohydroxyphosphoribosylaminopyrimidine [Actinomycetota bacterium]|jgi:diaminohydroxyphosphoribosylaminopyrimidine deaminase/5-amino-6-(5-phosphoribosylamino)uracil reductase